MSKKLISLLTTCALLIAFAIPVSADPNVINSSFIDRDHAATSSCEVTSTITSNYTVSLPATLALTQATQDNKVFYGVLEYGVKGLVTNDVGVVMTVANASIAKNDDSSVTFPINTYSSSLSTSGAPYLNTHNALDTGYDSSINIGSNLIKTVWVNSSNVTNNSSSLRESTNCNIIKSMNTGDFTNARTPIYVEFNNVSGDLHYTGTVTFNYELVDL